MATNGDRQTGTCDDGGNLLAGEKSTITVDLNAADPDQTEDIAPPDACTGGSQTVAKMEDGEFSKVGKVSMAGDNAPVDDIQKKIQRAERFGVPVQLSEEEKRNSRTERFGAANTSNGSETSKKDEELKRKARAERFGIPESSAPTDDDARKKARLARFGGGVKVDSVEEEKRKARAERFSKPASSSSSALNGTSNINQEAPVEGNVD